MRDILLFRPKKMPWIGHNLAGRSWDIFRLMKYHGSPASIFPLLARWRSSLPQSQPPVMADALRVEARRCFRLARGIASFELADELEAIGHAFENEAAAYPRSLRSALNRPGAAA